MAQCYVERYIGFEIVIDLVATGDCRVRITQQIIRQTAYRFSIVVDFENARRRVFASVKDAISTATASARDEIDAMTRRGPQLLH